MANSEGKLTITKKGLNGKIFIIPFYQRGYRWTTNEAQKLFNDLLDFYNSNEQEYCLQPIVLQTPKEYQNVPQYTKNTEILRVVDGQQRLTTIAILLDVLEISRSWDIYYLAEQKTLSQILTHEKNDSINDHFRNEVKAAFNKCGKDEKESIKKLINDEKPEKTVSFLRYDISTDANDREGHDAFLRLNDGKTPLTSSELIRALYMVNTSGLLLQERMEISKEWEIIENALCDEQFWLMFNSKGLSNTPTRIDLLFALVMEVSLENIKANPRIVFERMDDNQLDLRKIWLDVLHCFWWMQSCYNDVETFNYLCWINEFTGNSAKTIYDNRCKYPKLEDFKKSIIAIIQAKYENKTWGDFNYNCDKGELRALFVLLNLLDCNHNRERFRFDLYKNESWDIEHIDSQTPNELAKEETQKEWLISSYNELTVDEKNKFTTKFPNFQKNNITFQSSDKFQEMADEISVLWQFKQSELSDDEKIDDENAFGNITLLNTSINRSYKNAIFPAKRKTIKDFIVSGECYIPPCTAKAFMKFYTKSPSKITYWLKTDFKGYSDQMEEYFKKFMETPSTLAGTNPKVKDYQKKSSGDSVKEINQSTPCNNTENSKIAEITFTGFMDKYRVVIPKIQRLYVQGRLDSNGEKCLSAFAEALVRSVTQKESSPLDFIYGIENGNEFNPLDGQQRLTTLLLLAWICGKTQDKGWSFRYDSRRATGCFIDGLLSHTPPDLKKPDKYNDRKSNASKGYLPLCSNFIKESDWFLSAWEEDAGIAGMLEMLDSLYCKLLDAEKTSFDFSKITFFVNYLNASKESYDQIFLKMNSRGKPLTSWENVKAILDQNAPKDQHAKWQENLNNTWQELLWKKLGDVKDKIDRLNTKMLSVVELALACVGYEEKTKDNIFRLALWLEHKDNETSKDEFYKICSIFFSALENTEQVKTALIPAWGSVPLWPDFTQDNPAAFYRPLLAYYAAKQSVNADWMRMVWNIIENAGIERSNFPSAYALIKELSNHADDILDFLAKDDNKIVSQFVNNQTEEERAKAKQMVNLFRDRSGNSPGPNPDEIREAEKTAFFKGAIRFLYTNADGNIDWSQFKTKLENAKDLFDNKGLQDKKYPNANKILLSYCTDWDKQLKRKYLFGTSAGNWKQILLERNFLNQIHQLLTASPCRSDNEIDGDYKNEIRVLLNDVIWDFIKRSEVKDNYQLEWRDSACCLWLKNYPEWTLRLRESKLVNSFMQQIPTAIVLQRKRDNDIEVNGKIFLKNVGSFLKFIYKNNGQNYNFIWQHWGWIDLCDENFIPKRNGKSFEYQNINTFDANDFTQKLNEVIQK